MRVLDHAYSRGVRYFDAARSYGLAEEFLGSWLRSRRPAGVTVASKWGYTYTADWLIDVAAHEVKDLTAATLRRQLAETREHLGEWLQLDQIHSATIESGVLEDARSWASSPPCAKPALASASPRPARRPGGDDRPRGRDRRLRRGAGDVEPARARRRPGARDAHEAGLRVVVKESVANGRLAGAAPPELAAAARERGRRPTRSRSRRPRAALERRRAQRRVDHRDARQQPRGARVTYDAELDERLAGLAEPSADYWGERAALDWN